jgi:hypothetical protein
VAVDLRQYGVDTKLWSSGGNQGEEWHVTEFTATSALTHQFVFRGHRGGLPPDQFLVQPPRLTTPGTTLLQVPGSDYEAGDDSLLYKFHPESLTWHEARDACVQEGAHLVMETSDVIRKYVYTKFGDRGEMWIGVSDEETENVFKWVDGEKVAKSYWAYMEPNDHGNEDCVETNWGTAGQWNDRKCDAKHPFLCQGGDQGKKTY